MLENRGGATARELTTGVCWRPPVRVRASTGARCVLCSPTCRDGCMKSADELPSRAALLRLVQRRISRDAPRQHLDRFLKGGGDETRAPSRSPRSPTLRAAGRRTALRTHRSMPGFAQPHRRYIATSSCSTHLPRLIYRARARGARRARRARVDGRAHRRALTVMLRASAHRPTQRHNRVAMSSACSSFSITLVVRRRRPADPPPPLNKGTRPRIQRYPATNVASDKPAAGLPMADVRPTAPASARARAVARIALVTTTAGRDELI